MKELKKSDLEPGMKVRNIVSGNTGEVLGTEDGKLRDCAFYKVVVKRLVKSGKSIDKYREAFWNVDHLEIINA